MINESAVVAVKMVSGFFVSSGIGTIVGHAAKTTVPKAAPAILRSRPVLMKGFKLFHKIAIPAGAAALAGMTSEAAVRYSERKIDENVEAINNLEAITATTLKKVNDDAEAKKTKDPDLGKTSDSK